ncbi:MAG: hypothetical protein ACJ8FB_02955 [Sphingomicrobium sp.]
MLQLNDPSNNRGLGWTRLTEDQLIRLLYIGLKLADRRYRSDLTHRDATKADAAAKAIAKLIAERLRNYPVFGPARPSEGPTCGGGRDPVA